MTELERLAQLGNKEAQEECTRQGILIPCPFCGSRMKLLEGNSYFGSWMTMCVWCGAKTSETGNKVLAIAVSNSRPAPPVVHGAPIPICRPEKYEKYEPCGTSENGETLYLKRIFVDEKSRVMYCPACGKRLCSRFDNYCPNCGAKMDLEENQHEVL